MNKVYIIPATSRLVRRKIAEKMHLVLKVGAARLETSPHIRLRAARWAPS